MIRQWWRERQARQTERLVEEYRWNKLARYNGERDRGIVHTPDWQEHMKDEQAQFDLEMQQRRIRRLP